MEALVNYRSDQHITSDDLNNSELYAQQTFTDLINDAIDPGNKYAGLQVTASGTTSISVAAGQYFGGGQIYTITTPTVVSLISGLPVVANKIASVCVWGIQQQSNVQPRAFIINASTGQFQPQTVAMETSYVVQMSVVYGTESAAPTRGPIPNGVIVIADVLLTPSGVSSITMNSVTALGSVVGNSESITALESWQTSVELQINTLTTDLSILANSIPPNLAAALTALTQLVQQIWTIVNKPATAVWTAVQRFINTNDAQSGLSGYAAIVDDGLRFPAGNSTLGAISQLNPMDTGVVTIGNVTLPAFTAVLRHQFLPPPQASITIQTETVYSRVVWFGWLWWWWPEVVTSIIWTTVTIPANIVNFLYTSTYPVITNNWKKRHLRRSVVRYGDFVTSAIAVQPNGTILDIVCATNVVVNQTSAAGLAEIAARPALVYYQCNRIGGELYTLDWPTFWKLGEPVLLVSDRESGCWADYYDNPYWDAVYVTGSYVGSTIGHTFLNQSNGWLTHVQIFPNSLASSGDINLYICEVDGSYAPDLTKVMSQQVCPIGNFNIGPTGTMIPIVPCFLAQGTTYAIVLQTSGNHSFWSAAAAQQAGSIYQESVLWYQDSSGNWHAPAGGSQTPMFFCLYMAEFNSTLTTTQMNPGQLAAGISSCRVTNAGYAPPGTALTWEVQIGGVWIPLDADNAGALATLPTLLPLQAVFTGTADVQPAIDLTQAELELDQISTSLVYFSGVRTLGQATTHVQITAYITGWDGSHHTFGAKIHAGGTTYTPSTTVNTPNPTDPTQVTIVWNFTGITSTSTFYYELDATTVSGFGYPLATQVWDYAY